MVVIVGMCIFARKRQIKILQYDIIQHISMPLPAWGFCKTFKRCSRREPDSYITNLMICQNSKRRKRTKDHFGSRHSDQDFCGFTIYHWDRQNQLNYVNNETHFVGALYFQNRFGICQTQKLWLNSKWNPFTFYQKS